jgi:hypothetical protein
MTLDQMSGSTGIGRSYLEALEKDEIRELPGKAFGKLYIRAYAEVLEFDPQPWIDDYDRERRFDPQDASEPSAPEPVRPRAVQAAIAQWKENKLKARVEVDDEPAPQEEPEETPSEAPAIEPAPVTEPTPVPERAPVPARRSNRALLVLAGFVVLAIGAVAFVAVFRHGDKPAAPVARAEPAEPIAQPLPAPPVVAPRVEPPAQPAPRAAKPTPAPAPSGPLTVTEFGVGRRIVNLKLEGEDVRFAVGARVCFSTRVLGGSRGNVIRHVWLYEGRVEQSIPLRLGGADYRTHSNKTLGRTGSWAVEARDDTGQVLARVPFTCGPAGAAQP